MYVTAENGKVIDRTWVKENYHGEKEFVVPEGYLAIDTKAFLNIDSLKKITISSGIIEIGQSAFETCYGLKEVILPDSLLSIDSKAFSWCKDLNSVNFPERLYAIGDSAFRGCGLKELVLPNNIKVIEKNTFSDCDKLESVFLSNGLSKIPMFAFSNCKKLEYINIPDNVSGIGYCAFYGVGIKTLDLNNVVNLDSDAFSHCPFLEKVKYKELKNISSSCFADDERLVEVSRKDFCDAKDRMSLKRVIATDLDCNLLDKEPFSKYYASFGYRFKADDVISFDIYPQNQWNQTAKEKELAEFISNPSYENFKNMSCSDYKVPIAIAYGMSQNDEYKLYQDYIRKVGEKVIIKIIDEKNYDALLFYTDANKFTLKACETGLQHAIDTEDKEAYATLAQYKDKIKGYDKNTLKQFDL